MNFKIILQINTVIRFEKNENNPWNKLREREKDVK